MAKLKLAVFGAILAATAAAAELYARRSPQFASGHTWYLGHLQDAYQPNAVFGDSQVG